MNDEKAAKDPAREGGGGRSGMVSPYFDLGASLAVAEAVYNQWGGMCSPDQLAASLGYKSTASGTYLTRIAAAGKHFGFIDVNGDRVMVTERAKKALAPVMPEDASMAKVDAFLAVQLFNRVYEEFKGGQLPPEAGIKNLFLHKYGVLPDRVAQAARVFYNSAEQAGFFAATGDRSRLIKPSAVNGGGSPGGATPTPMVSKAPEGQVPPSFGHDRRPVSGEGAGAVHSAIVGLLRDLPVPGTQWSTKQKARFVKAFQATLDFVYPTEDEDGGIP